MRLSLFWMDDIFISRISSDFFFFFPRLNFSISLLQINAVGENNPISNLVPNLNEIDPDVAYSSVPYEKGFALLFHLEQLLGGPGKC